MTGNPPGVTARSHGNTTRNNPGWANDPGSHVVGNAVSGLRLCGRAFTPHRVEPGKLDKTDKPSCCPMCSKQEVPTMGKYCSDRYEKPQHWQDAIR